VPEYEYVGAGELVDDDEEAFWEAMPTTSTDQHCAVCRAPQPGWLHPLDGDKAAYRAWGKGYTLPMFWCLCERCEDLYQRGNDEELVQVRAASARAVGHDADGHVDGYEVVDEDLRKPLRAFRAADLGGRTLA
jgi:hypothetical protein